MRAVVLPKKDVGYLSDQLLDDRGLLKVMSAEFYSSVLHDDLKIFCHLHGVYTLPTIELIAWLRTHVVPGKTIEIGAGVGTVGRELGVPITDSCYMRNNPEVRSYYALMGQPITEYHEDIVELDAVDAVNKYQPEVVIGCWITHKFDESAPEREGNMFGVDEEYILKRVKKYIMVGNRTVHDLKPILKKPHKEYQFDWLYSRAANPKENVIYVWER
jgi:hypothetical protein